MHVAVFGAGYVGCVTAACLALLGHRIWLVEISPEKLALLCQGQSPVVEPGLDEALRGSLQSGQILPVAAAAEAVPHTELALICVGTPSQSDGAPNVNQVLQVCAEIAGVVAATPQPYVIALRSTVPAVSIQEALLPLLAAQLGERFGRDVGFAVNPEFLREGQALADFHHPPFIVVGTDHAHAAQALATLYQPLTAPYRQVSIGTASLLKYACNAFHALKIAFANELASLETAFAADANAVMELFCLDRTLNLSPAYLRPGYAFGGSCLPKDLRALNRLAAVTGVDCPVLHATLDSNALLIQRSVDAVTRLGKRAVTLIGLSFKPGTDDLRESPLVELAERLVGKGYHLRIYDPDVQPAELRGQNLRYIAQHLEHLTLLLAATLEAALHEAQLVIVGKTLLSAAQLAAWCAPGTVVLDLTRQLPLTLAPLRLLRLYDTTLSESV